MLRQPNHADSELCNRLGLTKGCMPFVINNSWYVNTKYILRIMLQSQVGRVLYIWTAIAQRVTVCYFVNLTL